MSSKLAEFPALDRDVLSCHGVVRVSCLADPNLVLGSGMRCMRRAALGVHRHGGPCPASTLRRQLLSRSVHSARETPCRNGETRCADGVPAMGIVLGRPGISSCARGDENNWQAK